MTFKFSDGQMQSFSRLTTDLFVSRVKDEVLDEMPHFCIGVELEELIHHGIQRCRIYDILTELAVGRYVRLMLVLGKDFDVDPDLPWAAEILNADRFENEFEKVDELTRSAIDYKRESPQQGGGN